MLEFSMKIMKGRLVSLQNLIFNIPFSFQFFLLLERYGHMVIKKIVGLAFPPIPLIQTWCKGNMINRWYKMNAIFRLNPYNCELPGGCCHLQIVI